MRQLLLTHYSPLLLKYWLPLYFLILYLVLTFHLVIKHPILLTLHTLQYSICKLLSQFLPFLCLLYLLYYLLMLIYVYIFSSTLTVSITLQYWWIYLMRLKILQYLLLGLYMRVIFLCWRLLLLLPVLIQLLYSQSLNFLFFTNEFISCLKPWIKLYISVLWSFSTHISIPILHLTQTDLKLIFSPYELNLFIWFVFTNYQQLRCLFHIFLHVNNCLYLKK